MIQRKQIGDTYLCYDAEIVANPTLPLFDADYWQQNNLVQGSALGRGTTWFVQLGDRQAALRHYRRGGLFGKLVKDRYWFTSWDKTRSVAEFELLSQLRTAGVNVPRPIAARAVKKGPFYQADLLSERIANAQDLVALLHASHLGAERYHQIGIEIAKMHQVGVNHTDLNIHNILLDDQQKVWIIDFDKCFAQPGEAWKQANLARLLRSFNKELVKRNIHWQRDDFQALLQGYQSIQ